MRKSAGSVRNVFLLSPSERKSRVIGFVEGRRIVCNRPPSFFIQRLDIKPVVVEDVTSLESLFDDERGHVFELERRFA